MLQTQHEDSFEGYGAGHPGWMRLSAMVDPDASEAVEFIGTQPDQPRRRRRQNRLTQPSPAYIEFVGNRVEFGPDFDSAA